MTDFWLQILVFVRVGLCLSVVIFEFGIAVPDMRNIDKQQNGDMML
jgi:hypothetical protein